MIVPSISSLLTEEYLSWVNPYLLQAEIAAAVVLGIGIIYESDKFPDSVHNSAFWFVVIGVVLETVFSVCLFMSEEHIVSLQRRKIIFLDKGLKVAEMNLSDRIIPREVMDSPFGIDSNLGGHVGQKLHILVVEHDDEAERFANSLRDTLYNLYGWDVTISPIAEGPSIVNPIFARHSMSRVGRLPPGIFGPFGGDDSNIMLRSAKTVLYGAIFGSGFCIEPVDLRNISDPSPSVITLVVSRKNRHSSDCK